MPANLSHACAAKQGSQAQVPVRPCVRRAADSPATPHPALPHRRRPSPKQEEGEDAGPSLSFWGMATALRDSVKQRTAELAASIQDTDWRKELGAFQQVGIALGARCPFVPGAPGAWPGRASSCRVDRDRWLWRDLCRG